MIADFLASVSSACTLGDLFAIPLYTGSVIACAILLVLIYADNILFLDRAKIHLVFTIALAGFSVFPVINTVLAGIIILAFILIPRRAAY